MAMKKGGGGKPAGEAPECAKSPKKVPFASEGGGKPTPMPTPDTIAKAHKAINPAKKKERGGR